MNLHLNTTKGHMPMPFAIVVSEKGGQEKRELFEKEEITIGRVQGNDLLLPKGNVSKKHARILFREGRIMITDLRSTNGSFVNGHRISEATVVREGDRIYIGDFVLRIETENLTNFTPQISQRNELDELALLRNDSEMRMPTSPRIRSAQDVGSASRIPSEHDLEKESDARLSSRNMRSTERHPGSIDSIVISSSGRPSSERMSLHEDSSQQADSDPVLNRGTLGYGAIPSSVLAKFKPFIDAKPIVPSSVVSQSVAEEQPARPTFTSSEYAQPLMLLMSQLARIVDLESPHLDREPFRSSTEQALHEQATELLANGEIGSSIPVNELVRLAAREVFDLGPLRDWLSDDAISSIDIERFDRIHLDYVDSAKTSHEFGFTSETALRRALLRLASAQGFKLQPSEPILELNLDESTQLRAIFPPLSSKGIVAYISKLPRVLQNTKARSADEIMSPSMKNCVSACIQNRANLLIVSPDRNTFAYLVSMFLSDLKTETRVFGINNSKFPKVLVLPEHCSTASFQGLTNHPTLIPSVLAMNPDCTIIDTLADSWAKQTMQAIHQGQRGIVAFAYGASLPQAAVQLASALMTTEPKLDWLTAQQWLDASFDLWIEATEFKNMRISRISECCGVEHHRLQFREIFHYSANTIGSNKFRTTGVTPAFIQKIKAQGFSIDETLFRADSMLKK